MQQAKSLLAFAKAMLKAALEKARQMHGDDSELQADEAQSEAADKTMAKAEKAMDPPTPAIRLRVPRQPRPRRRR
ncbi:MAG: hypothetical protein WDN45_14105 [Caulobacteraceae bacterium]